MQGIRLRCPAGTHNDVATAFYSTADDFIGRLFSVGESVAENEGRDHDPGFTQRSLLIYTMLYLPMMALACGMAVPAGLFMPAIMLGASAGLNAGLALQRVLPDAWPVQPGAAPPRGACLDGTLQCGMFQWHARVFCSLRPFQPGAPLHGGVSAGPVAPGQCLYLRQRPLSCT